MLSEKAQYHNPVTALYIQYTVHTYIHIMLKHRETLPKESVDVNLNQILSTPQGKNKDATVSTPPFCVFNSEMISHLIRGSTENSLTSVLVTD